MGRKRKEKVGIFDRIGEEVNLEKCPECIEHPDCFSCLNGRCTALNVSGGQGCSFFKPAAEGVDDCRDVYQRLKKAGRFDLIGKYLKAYTAMGFLDDEIDLEEVTMKKLEDYRESDFKSIMMQVPGFD